MEVDYSLTKYIKVFDNTFPECVLENLIKICKESQKFEKATIIKSQKTGDLEIDTEIRKTFTWPMKNIGVKSLTEVHWTNLLYYAFSEGIDNYLKSIKTESTFKINDIQILKYNVGGYYKFHTDSAISIPRTFSCIFLLNDDYKGGELVFKFPGGENEYKINKQKNRMIIWPSNFLYPHSVLPVIEGTRYSVVSWAL